MERVSRESYCLVRDILSPLRDNGMVSPDQFQSITNALYCAHKNADELSKYQLISKDTAIKMLADISLNTLDRMIAAGTLRTSAITRNRVGIYLVDVEKVIISNTKGSDGKK